MDILVTVSTKEQLEAALTSRASFIFAEADISEETAYEELVNRIRAAGKKAGLAFPYVVRSFTEKRFTDHAETLRKAGFDGYIIRSMESLDYALKNRLTGTFYADQGLYAFNSASVEVLKDIGFGYVTVPYELNFREAAETGFSGEILTVYGHLPMMVTQNCIRKTLGKCEGKPEDLVLRDRLGHGMRVENHCRFCYNLILNTVPLSLLSCRAEAEALAPGGIKLMFTGESGEETARIIRSFSAAFLDGKPLKDPEGTTRGHFKRGVE